MPCYDERNDSSYIVETEVRPLREKVRKLEAMLCGILSAAPLGTIAVYDERRAGVPKKELIEWWEAHQMADAKREIDEKRKERNKRRLNRMKTKRLTRHSR